MSGTGHDALAGAGDRALEVLQKTWAGIFDISLDGGKWSAEPVAEPGDTITAGTPGELGDAMNAAWRSGPARDKIGNWLRIEELRDQGVTIGAEFGSWCATVQQEDGERTLARHTLRALLDDVNEILAGGDPRARPG